MNMSDIEMQKVTKLVALLPSGAAVAPSVPVKRFMRLPAVMAATGKSRTTIYDNMRAATFPQSLSIGPRSIAWDADEFAA